MNIRGRENNKDDTRQEPAGHLRQVIANAPNWWHAQPKGRRP